MPKAPQGIISGNWIRRPRVDKQILISMLFLCGHQPKLAGDCGHDRVHPKTITTPRGSTETKGSIQSHFLDASQKQEETAQKTWIHSEAHKQGTIASNRMTHPSNRDQQAKRPSRPAHVHTAEHRGTSQHEPRFAFEEFAKREIENFTSMCHLSKHAGQGPDW